MDYIQTELKKTNDIIKLISQLIFTSFVVMYSGAITKDYRFSYSFIESSFLIMLVVSFTVCLFFEKTEQIIRKYLNIFKLSIYFTTYMSILFHMFILVKENLN